MGPAAQDGSPAKACGVRNSLDKIERMDCQDIIHTWMINII